MTKRGVAFFEVIIAFAVISVLAYYGFQRYSNMIIESRESALKQELKVLREGIEVYRIRNNSFPKNLEELEKKGYINFGGTLRVEFGIEYKKNNGNGKLCDPFGEVYQYNMKTGRVNSRNIKYKRW